MVDGRDQRRESGDDVDGTRRVAEGARLRRRARVAQQLTLCLAVAREEAGHVRGESSRKRQHARPIDARRRKVASRVAHRHATKPKLDVPVVGALRHRVCDDAGGLVAAVVLVGILVIDAYAVQRSAVDRQSRSGIEGRVLGRSQRRGLVHKDGRPAVGGADHVIVELIRLHAHVEALRSAVAATRDATLRILAAWDHVQRRRAVVELRNRVVRAHAFDQLLGIRDGHPRSARHRRSRHESFGILHAGVVVLLLDDGRNRGSVARRLAVAAIATAPIVVAAVGRDEETHVGVASTVELGHGVLRIEATQGSAESFEGRYHALGVTLDALGVQALERQVGQVVLTIRNVVHGASSVKRAEHIELGAVAVVGPMRKLVRSGARRPQSAMAGKLDQLVRLARIADAVAKRTRDVRGAAWHRILVFGQVPVAAVMTDSHGAIPVADASHAGIFVLLRKPWDVLAGETAVDNLLRLATNGPRKCARVRRSQKPGLAIRLANAVPKRQLQTRLHELRLIGLTQQLDHLASVVPEPNDDVRRVERGANSVVGRVHRPADGAHVVQ